MQTPRERAIKALYGPDCDPARIEPGPVTEAVEGAITAAATDERARCVAIVKYWFGGDDIWDRGYECVREIMT